jgi:hypothetical protein
MRRTFGCMQFNIELGQKNLIKMEKADMETAPTTADQ